MAEDAQTEVSKLTFEWKLANLDDIMTQPYKSQVFWTSDKHPWYVKNCPREDDEHISLYLVAQCNDDAEAIFFVRRYVEYKLFIRIGGEKFTKQEFCNFTQQWPSYGWRDFASIAMLLKAELRIPSNEGIFVGVRISMPGMNTLSKPSSSLATSAFFLSLFNSVQFSDVVIRVPTGQVYAHKDVLITRSDYFAALFRSGMNETHILSDNGKMVVEIVDFSYAAVYTMIWYLYTNSLDFRAGPEIAPREIFEISDKYQVEGLRDVFSNNILGNLTVNNVVETLFQYGYRFKALRQGCLEFIGDHFEEVKNSKSLDGIEWNDENYKEYAELMKEIVKTI